MTRILCAATNCKNNEGGTCSEDEIVFSFVSDSDEDLHCAYYTEDDDAEFNEADDLPWDAGPWEDPY